MWVSEVLLAYRRVQVLLIFFRINDFLIDCRDSITWELENIAELLIASLIAPSVALIALVAGVTVHIGDLHVAVAYPLVVAVATAGHLHIAMLHMILLMLTGMLWFIF